MSNKIFECMDDDFLYYHYTSINSFNEIVNSKKIWLSDCRFLNDKKEISIAIEKFVSNFNDEEKKILSYVLDLCNFDKYFCIFSMSKSPRVLSQWRGYGDDGKGICIGFRKNFLELFFSSEKTAYDTFLIHCIYENFDDHIQKIIEDNKKNIDSIVKLYRNSRAINEFSEKIRGKYELFSNIYRELLRIKNPSFKEEQEVRIVRIAPLPLIKTRVCNGLIIPYTEIDLSDDKTRDGLQYIMKELWLGPKCDKRNREAIRSYGLFGWGLFLNEYDCGYI